MELYHKYLNIPNCNKYHNILDFENSNEKKCSKLDRLNEKVYKRLLIKANQAEKTVKNTGLHLNLEVPTPPHPSNRDKYIIWKKRNCNQPVILQTESVLYLEQNGYKYNIDYEAYQAISLANEIKKDKGIQLKFKDNTKNFDNVYTPNDRNVLRRKSIHVHNNINPILEDFKNNYIEEKQLPSRDFSYKEQVPIAEPTLPSDVVSKATTISREPTYINSTTKEQIHLPRIIQQHTLTPNWEMSQPISFIHSKHNKINPTAPLIN